MVNRIAVRSGIHASSVAADGTLERVTNEPVVRPGEVAPVLPIVESEEPKSQDEIDDEPFRLSEC